MLSARLIWLIENHADALTKSTLKDIMTNPKTPSFHSVSREEMESRIYRLYHNLGTWIGSRNEAQVEEEYFDLGRRRRADGVPLSELVYAVILYKHHLRQYIQDHGLIEAAADAVTHADMLPVHLHGVQELNYMVGHFFDQAMYHVARGYESRSGK